MLTVTLHDLPENVMAATPALSEAMGQQEPLLIEPQTSLVWLRARPGTGADLTFSVGFWRSMKRC